MRRSSRRTDAPARSAILEAEQRRVLEVAAGQVAVGDVEDRHRRDGDGEQSERHQALAPARRNRRQYSTTKPAVKSGTKSLAGT